MPDEINDQQLGLDASGMESTLDRLESRFERFSKVLDDTAQSFANVSDLGTNVEKTFTEIDEKGRKLSQTYAVIADKTMLVAASYVALTINEQKYAASLRATVQVNESYAASLDRIYSKLQAGNKIKTEALQSAAREADDLRILQSFLQSSTSGTSLNPAISEERRLTVSQGLLAAEIERARTVGQTTHVLEQQNELAKQDAEYNRLITQYEREQAAISQQKLRGQLQVTKELAAAQAKAERSQSADQVGSNLRSQFLGRGLGSGDETRILTSIGQIQTAIRNGAVEAARANQIIESVINKEGQIFEGAEARVANSTNRILSANKSIEQSFGEVERTGSKSGLNILLSWSSLSRLLTVQLLHTAIREVINLMGQAIQETSQFETRIAELQTISQTSALSFDQWSESVKHLSDQFGSPILDTTEAFYQGLSSQLVKGADAATLVSHALEFSRVTASTTAESMNLLTSALNSYQLTAADTERVQGVLFKTITLGKLRAEDLAGSFGRVGPFAHQLGISIEEVGAAIATLTRSGVPATEAITLIESVLTRLVKPSKDMTKFFEDIGVSSGTNAIQIYGFANVLGKLQEASRGSSEELAQLFPRLESLRGSLSLTSNLGGFQHNLEDITKNALPEFKRALEISFQPPAVEFQRQMQQIKNYVLQEFAEPAIKRITELGNLLSKDGLSGAFKNLVPIVSTGAAGLIAYCTASTLVATGQKLQAYWAEIDNKNLSQNLFIRKLDTEAINEQVAADLQLLRAEQLLAAGEVEEAAAASAAAEAHLASAAAAREASVAAAAAATGTTLLGTAMETLLSPTAIITGALFGISALAYNIHSLALEQEKAAKQAFEIASDGNRKISEDLEKSLSRNDEAWTKSLERRFVGYTEFAGSVTRQIREITEAEVDYTNEATASSRQAIQDLERDAESNIHKLEEAQKNALREVQDAQRQVNREQVEFDDKAFQRKLQLAQHADALGTPGSDLHLVDQNQINLEAAELKRLQGGSISTGDPKGDLEAHRKNVADQEKIVSDQFARRLRLEQERKALTEQIANEERRISEHQATQAQRAEASSVLPGGKHGTEQSGVRQGLREEAEAQRQLNEQQNDQKTLDNLKARAKALDDSLKVLPQINDFEKTFVDLQNQSRKALEAFIKAQQDAAAAADKQAKLQQSNFEKLKLTLTELEKLKYDKLLGSDNLTQEKSDKFLGRFDDLTQNAQAAGLTDQGVLSKLATERAAIEESFNLKLKEIEQKASSERINQIKSEIEQRKQGLRDQIVATNKSLLEEIGPVIESIIGHSSQDGQRGAIGQALITAATHVAPGVRGFATDAHQEALLKSRGVDVEGLREQYRQVIKSVQESGTGTINPKVIESFIAALDKFNAGINSGFNVTGITGSAPGSLKAETGRFDPQGRPLPNLSVQDEIKRLYDLAGATQSVIAQHNAAVNQGQEQTRLLELQLVRLRDLVGAQQAQNQAILDDTKSFKDLGAELVHVVDGMQNLKAILDKFPPVAIQHHDSGGWVSGPSGRDRVPAMLTSHEFVVNDHAAALFRPQLEWMNSFNSGGSVPQVTYKPQSVKSVNRATSVAFGDIHLSVQSSGSHRIDAKALAQELEREIRMTGHNLFGANHDE